MRVNAARRPHRVVAIVVVFVVALGVWSRAIVHATWLGGYFRGMVLHPYRDLLAYGDPARGPLDLLWLGDSTIASILERTSYASAIAADLGRDGVHAEVGACLGLDAFGYDALLRTLLARGPRVVVLIANFRLFAASGYWSYADLLGAAPLAELPRQLALPYERRGMSAARLVLSRTLRWRPAIDAMFWTTGIRHIADGAKTWDVLGPRAPSQSREWNALGHYADAALASYVTPRSREDPSVRMIEAAVERTADAGARTVVIVTPVPVDRLRDRGYYDAAAYGRAVGFLRDAVEAHGGTLLDLHAALPRDQFRDIHGHFTPQGDDTMRRLAAPPILQALGRVPVAQRVAAAPVSAR